MCFQGNHGFVIALIKKKKCITLANNLIKEHLWIQFELVGMNSGLSLGMCIQITPFFAFMSITTSECDFLALFFCFGFVCFFHCATLA